MLTLFRMKACVLRADHTALLSRLGNFEGSGKMGLAKRS